MSLKESCTRFFKVVFENQKESRFEKFIKNIFNNFSITEKVLFVLFGIMMIVSSAVLLTKINNNFLVKVPGVGGKISEGLIGSPRFVNPILAISDTDKVLSSLVFSGLVKYNKNGDIENDLASNIEISEDGLSYTASISEHAYFHDNTPVTSDDVIFTIEKALDPVIKSPKQKNFSGIKLEKIDDKNIRFTLSDNTSYFLDSLSIGILPKHIWQSATSEEFAFSPLNINPIGAGPYEVTSTKKNSAGIPTSMTFTISKKYPRNTYKIKNINFKFYTNEETLKKNLLEGEVTSGALLTNNNEITSKFKENKIYSSLPRVFGLFFNQNTAQIFLNPEVREAMDISAPKDKIVADVLGGNGMVLTGISPTLSRPHTNDYDLDSKIEKATSILEKSGWQKDESGVMTKKKKEGIEKLEFSIATSDNPELKKVADILKEIWGSIGIKVNIEIFEISDLNQNVIKTRKYETLLFGEIVNNESDLYTFWHSSERNDPGLNIAMYANIKTDKILEDIKSESDPKKRKEKMETLSKEITKDTPAIFLFSPGYTYVFNPDIKNANLKTVSSTYERFLSLEDWYIETERVWKIFATN